MLASNYSQLPVMEGDKKVNGAISWKSIGSSQVTKMEVTEVRHCVAKCPIANDTDSVFEVAYLIAEHDFVLVRDTTCKIIGIVTASDLTTLFHDLYEPFYLTGAVESNVRQIAKYADFNSSDFDRAKMKNHGNMDLERLSLGQINQLIGPKENWCKLMLMNVDCKIFRKSLCRVRKLRNDVMHFRTHNMNDEAKSFLRGFSQFVQNLADGRRTN